MNLKENIPTTLLEAIKLLVDNLNEKDREFIKTHEPASVHFFTGMSLRNNWNLWKKDCPIVKDIKKKYNLSHGDDCSGLILTGVWASVKELCIKDELQKTADRFLAHWKREGVDPNTGRHLKNYKAVKNMTIQVDKNGNIHYLD